MTHLGSLTDEELISRVRTHHSATPLERELARRLADAIDTIDDDRNLHREIEEMTATNARLSEQVSELEGQLHEIQTREVHA
jgi:hypothetical protein